MTLQELMKIINSANYTLRKGFSHHNNVEVDYKGGRGLVWFWGKESGDALMVDSIKDIVKVGDSNYRIIVDYDYYNFIYKGENNDT